MSNATGSQKRSDLLGRLQTASDRHDAAEATETNRLNAADVDKQFLADLRMEAESLRNAAAALREAAEAAKRIIEELTEIARRSMRT